MVSVSKNGNRGMSFGYMDKELVFYDLERLVVNSRTKMEMSISSYCFNPDASKSLLSFERSTDIVVWDHTAPSHRWKSELKGHKNFVFIVKISDDSEVALSCSLAMKLIYWSLPKKEAIKSI